MKTKFFFAVCAVFLVLNVRAQVTSNSPNLPPTNGQYVANGPITYTVGSVFIQVNNLDLMNPSANTPPPTTIGGTANSFFDVFVDLNLGINGGAFTPTTATGAVNEQIILSNENGNTATYNTQMTEMNISGGTLPGGMMIRIDPVTPSTGQTTISNPGGGQFHINSFFDIFTDISLDNGQTWTPNNGGSQVLTLDPNPLPEPSSIALLSLGAAGLLWKLRRKR